MEHRFGAAPVLYEYASAGINILYGNSLAALVDEWLSEFSAVKHALTTIYVQLCLILIKIYYIFTYIVSSEDFAAISCWSRASCKLIT